MAGWVAVRWVVDDSKRPSLRCAGRSCIDLGHHAANNCHALVAVPSSLVGVHNAPMKFEGPPKEGWCRTSPPTLHGPVPLL